MDTKVDDEFLDPLILEEGGDPLVAADEVGGVQQPGLAPHVGVVVSDGIFNEGLRKFGEASIGAASGSLAGTRGDNLAGTGDGTFAEGGRRRAPVPSGSREVSPLEQFQPYTIPVGGTVDSLFEDDDRDIGSRHSGNESTKIRIIESDGDSTNEGENLGLIPNQTRPRWDYRDETWQDPNIS